MKKFLIAGAIVLIFAAYVFYQHEQNNKVPTAQVSTITNPAPANNSSSTSDTNPTSALGETTNPSANSGQTTSGSSGNTASSGTYKDGSYTGSVADAFYGKMQVQATIQGGKITDVEFLQYPNDRGETQQVNGRALPILKSEAIAAQSANVDIVSSATQSSQAFQQSLQSALSQAMS